MLEKFWEVIGTDVGKKWVERILSPALLFWMGGIVAYLFAEGSTKWLDRWDVVWNWINAQQPMLQGGLVISCLVLFALSATWMEVLRKFLLRFLEGYWSWPFRRLAIWIGQLRAKIRWRDELAYNTLKGKEEKSKQESSTLDSYELYNLSHLEMKLNYTPVDPKKTMMSGLGDILRSGEEAPRYKYGLDAVVCWPRLWVLLPQPVQNDLTAARQSLDQRVELWGWGLLFLTWSFWSLWAIPIAILWMALAYSLCKQAAMGYADLIVTAFDLYRFDLYKALRLPVPSLAAQEIQKGQMLTEYIWRGKDKDIFFCHPKED